MPAAAVLANTLFMWPLYTQYFAYEILVDFISTFI